jgi:bifunctional non-homologous end joining protein LigD
VGPRARRGHAAPTGDEWLHEVKYDGFRVVVRRDGSRVTLLSRNGLDWTGTLPHLVEAALALPCTRCILDGELVALDERGQGRFGLLQQWMGDPRAARQIVAFVFDLLYLDGEDLRASPLTQRKAALSRLLGRRRGALRPSAYLEGHGPQAYAHACRTGLEGIICKRRDAPYRAGRTDAWLKVKCVASDEFVVIGYTAGKGAREKLGAVLLAKPTRNGKTYRYVGRVGSGFTEALIDELFRHVKHRSEPVALVEPPSRADLRGGRVTWVDPRVIVEVHHRGMTEDGRVRQGAIKGLRPDKRVGDLRGSDRQVSRGRRGGQ